MDSEVQSRALGGSSLSEHTPAHGTSELLRTEGSLPQCILIDELQAILQPITMELVDHDPMGELPLSVVINDVVAFKHTTMKSMFYFAVVKCVLAHSAFVVTVKKEGDKFYEASGPNVLVSHTMLVATNLMTSKTGRGFNFGGPHCFHDPPIYTWWKDPIVEGMFEAGDVLSAKSRYTCSFLVLCFFKWASDYKIAAAEVQPDKDGILVVRDIFHAEVSRFLREGWQVDHVDKDGFTVLNEETAKFLKYFESGQLSKVQNKLEWHRFYLKRQGSSQQTQHEEHDSSKEGDTTKDVRGDTGPKATSRKRFSEASIQKQKFSEPQTKRQKKKPIQVTTTCKKPKATIETRSAKTSEISVTTPSRGPSPSTAPLGPTSPWLSSPTHSNTPLADTLSRNPITLPMYQLQLHQKDMEREELSTRHKSEIDSLKRSKVWLSEEVEKAKVHIEQQDQKIMRLEHQVESFNGRMKLIEEKLLQLSQRPHQSLYGPDYTMPPSNPYQPYGYTSLPPPPPPPPPPPTPIPSPTPPLIKPPNLPPLPLTQQPVVDLESIIAYLQTIKKT